MRKITPKKYAVSLYETLHQADREKIPALLKSFLAILIRNQDLKKSDKIIKAFIAYANDKEKHVEVTLSSAKTLDTELKDKVIDQLAKSLNREISVREEVDPSLLGGLILKYDDVVVDGSVKKKIELLAENLRS